MTLLLVVLGLLVWLLGLVFGSFVTALVYRQRQGLSMWARHSVCPHCKHALSTKDLVPVVSYVWQGGKCRYCGQAIGRQYMAVELLSGLLFVSLAAYMWWQFEQQWMVDSWWVWLVAAFMAVMLILLLAMSVYDVRWRELPNAWTLGGAVLALLMAVLAEVLDQPLLWQPQLSGVEAGWLNSLVSGLATAIGFAVVAWLAEKVLRKSGMGFGDVKLALLMGFFLGFPGVVVALYVAFISGAMLSLVLIAGRRKSLGGTLPFGPFLALGVWLALFITEPVINWYLGLLM